MKQIDPLLELEEQCRSYQPSGSSPVFINPGNSTDDFIRRDSRFIRFTADDYIRSDPRFMRFTDSDGNIREFNWHMIGDVIYRPILPWSQYLQANSIPGGDRDHALLFLHERCAKGEAARLVAVELSTGCTFREQIRISVINSDRSDRTQGVRRAGCDLRDLTEPRYVVKFFEGQADPADESHFTIRFIRIRPGARVSPYAIEVTHESAILDGWLQGDDRVQLKVRDEKSGK